jgi:hypothetical protein
MTDTHKNAGGTTQSNATRPHSERVDVNKRGGAQDDAEEAYPFELMPVGDPRPQGK